MSFEAQYYLFMTECASREPPEVKPGQRKAYAKHHIVARHLNGTNAPSNIIRMYDDDHFWAHILMAVWLNTKKAWSATRFFCAGQPDHTRRDYIRRVERQAALYSLGYIKQFVIEQPPERVMHQQMVTETVTGTLPELSEKLGISLGKLSQCAIGQRRRVDGWFYEGVVWD